METLTTRGVEDLRERPRHDGDGHYPWVRPSLALCPALAVREDCRDEKSPESVNVRQILGAW